MLVFLTQQTLRDPFRSTVRLRVYAIDSFHGKGVFAFHMKFRGPVFEADL